MSWDEAYNELKKELGREPGITEIQKKMFEIAQAGLKDPQND